MAVAQHPDGGFRADAVVMMSKVVREFPVKVKSARGIYLYALDSLVESIIRALTLLLLLCTYNIFAIFQTYFNQRNPIINTCQLRVGRIPIDNNRPEGCLYNLANAPIRV